MKNVCVLKSCRSKLVDINRMFYKNTFYVLQIHCTKVCYHTLYIHNCTYSRTSGYSAY